MLLYHIGRPSIPYSTADHACEGMISRNVSDLHIAYLLFFVLLLSRLGLWWVRRQPKVHTHIGEVRHGGLRDYNGRLVHLPAIVWFPSPISVRMGSSKVRSPIGLPRWLSINKVDENGSSGKTSYRDAEYFELQFDNTTSEKVIPIRTRLRRRGDVGNLRALDLRVRLSDPRIELGFLGKSSLGIAMLLPWEPGSAWDFKVPQLVPTYNFNLFDLCVSVQVLRGFGPMKAFRTSLQPIRKVLMPSCTMI